MIRPFKLKDYYEVVMMYKSLTKSIYTHREIGEDIHFFRMVDMWVKNGYDIYVTEVDGDISGFFCGYVHHNFGLTEPVYFGDSIYVKDMYRKGKSAYQLYKKIVEIADSKKLKTVSHAYIFGDAYKIHEKLGSHPISIITERPQGA